MNTYIKTFGEPGERLIEVHIETPGLDSTICGLDTAGDDLVHDKEPERLPKGWHKVTCQACNRIIDAVKVHLRS